MIELMLGALVVSGMLCIVPQAVADMVATVRASAAGQWDLIDRQRERRQERWAKAWGAVRTARNRRAGGNGNYRPGASAYMGDLYHGFWEDRLEKRGVKRAARPPYEYDPDAPKWHERVDAAVLDKVERLRTVSGRVGRVLIEPVGERREPAEPLPTPAMDTAGADDISTAQVNVHLAELAPNCPKCGERMVAAPYTGPAIPPSESRITPPHECPNCAAQVALQIAAHPNGAAWAAGQQFITEDSSNGTKPEGDTIMATATTSDVLKYNQAVADHEQALASLRIQLDQAAALASHLTAAVGAVEGMDNVRDQVATATTALTEGLEQGRYGAASLEGAATSAEILTAGQVSTTQEAIEVAQTQNQEWIAGLEVAIAGVEASLTEIQTQFGEAAAVVQETGIDGRALEAE